LKTRAILFLDGGRIPNGGPGSGTMTRDFGDARREKLRTAMLGCLL
jgi:hypothetical protein